MNAQEAASTYNCKFPNCTNEAKSSRGRWSYCETHQGQAKAKRLTAAAPGSVEQRIKSLASLARDVDRAKAKARKLTEDALAAKHEADAKEAQFERTMRDVLEPEQPKGETA